MYLLQIGYAMTGPSYLAFNTVKRNQKACQISSQFCLKLMNPRNPLRGEGMRKSIEKYCYIETTLVLLTPVD